MPLIETPTEFLTEEIFKLGFRGIFVGGCIERKEGSSFRRKAHAHCWKDKKYTDPYFGYICVRSAKRLYNSKGEASLLLWHELAHIATRNGHTKKFYLWLREYSTIRKDEERTSQWAYLCRHYKNPTKAYKKIKEKKNGNKRCMGISER